MHRAWAATSRPRARSRRNTARPAWNSAQKPPVGSSWRTRGGIFTPAKARLARAAPTTSLRRTTGRGKAAYRAAPITGPRRKAPPLSSCIQPLARTNWSAGTSWGRMDWMAGCWKVLPTPRRPSRISTVQGGRANWPSRTAYPRAAPPMARSAVMHRTFRFHRSAATPARGLSRVMGR